MSKDIRKPAFDKGGASPAGDGFLPDAPSDKFQRDKWTFDPVAYADTPALFCLERDRIEIETRKRDGITKDDAVALAKRIKDLYASNSFDGRDGYVAFLAGQCLKLKEGQPADKAFTATAMLKAKNPPPAFPEWRGPQLKQIIKLAVPAELHVKSGAFGAEGFSWLSCRSEDFARDRARKGCKRGSPASRWFDGGDFLFALSQPEPGSIPVVPAPDEATIKKHVKRAESKVDYWDALRESAAILHKCRQPVGDALQGWLIEAAGQNAKRPKNSTRGRFPKTDRNRAIIDVVSALERVGMKAMTNDRDPGPACAACGTVFGLAAVTVLDVWKGRGAGNSME